MENLKNIISPIESELALFEKNLKELIDKENNFLKPDLRNFMFNNAKRLRPIFIFLFSKILNINNPLVEKIALITELVHNASLIHDDIIDNSKLRRNLKTFNEKYDNKLATLEGDLLLSIALFELSQTNLEILKIFSDKIKSTLNGEINQNSNLGKIQSEQDYILRSYNKTGNLFLAGFLSLLTLKDCNKKTTDSLINFIKNYSLAFQIKNDLDDIKKDNSDYKNGNYTLAVIYFSCKKYDKEHCINLAEAKKEEFKALALKELDKIQDSIYKDSILNLCKYTLRS